MPTITVNKKTLHDFSVLQKFEAGLELSGPEVKSVKAGQINLKGSYISIGADNQAWLKSAYIAKYKPAKTAQQNYDAEKPRKLLIKKKEIDYLRGKSREKGLTIMPISVYTKGSLIKLEIAVVRGKKQFDKRSDIKKRDIEREIRRKLKK